MFQVQTNYLRVQGKAASLLNLLVYFQTDQVLSDVRGLMSEQKPEHHNLHMWCHNHLTCKTKIYHKIEPLGTVATTWNLELIKLAFHGHLTSKDSERTCWFTSTFPVYNEDSPWHQKADLLLWILDNSSDPFVSVMTALSLEITDTTTHFTLSEASSTHLSKVTDKFD